MPFPISKLIDAVEAFLSVQTWEDGKALVLVQRSILLDPRVSQLMLDMVPAAVSREEQWKVANLQISRRILDNCRENGIDRGFDAWLTPVPLKKQLSLYKKFLECSNNRERTNFRIEYPEIEFQLIQMRNGAIEMRLSLNYSSDLSGQIETIKEELRRTDPLDDTYKWAYIKNYLGKVLALSNAPGRIEHLQDAIQQWKEALEILQPNIISEGMLWSEIQVNLAMAYTDHRMSGNRSTNFEMAQSCIDEAFTYYNLKFTPLEWGTTQLRMAEIYTERPQPDFQKAIEHMKVALNIITKYSNDLSLTAKIQADLGITYFNSQIDNYAENVEEAIQCFKKSLQLFVKQNDLENQRKIYLNLSEAYNRRIKGEPKSNQEMADQYLKKGLANG